MAKKVEKAEKPAKKEKKAKKALTPEQIEKRKKRMEAIKNRPAGQRPNSKQVDIIDLENGCKLKTFGYAIRKKGTLVTTVLEDVKGNAISTSITFVPGTKVKSKKGHGTIIPGLAGVGKDSEVEEPEEIEETEADDED